MRKPPTLIGSIALVFTLLHFGACPGEAAEYTFYSGGSGGNYERLALRIAECMKRESPSNRLKVIASAGSMENLDALLSGDADIAIVQSNIAAACTDLGKEFRGIASLYTECAQIAVPSDSPVREIDDLRGLRLWLGGEGSGSIDDARRLLNAAGVFRTDYEQVIGEVGNLSEAFESGKIDAVILTTGVPHPGIGEIRPGVRLIGLKQDLIKELLAENRDMVLAEIAAGTYPGQRRGIVTVGARALLICRKDLDADLVNKIASIISNDPELGEMIRKTGSSPDILELADRAMPIPLHSGSADFFRFRLISASAMKRWGPCFLVIGAVFFFWGLAGYSRMPWCRSVRRHKYQKLILGLLTVYLLATVVIYYCERDWTPGFESLARSFWSTMVYVLSGLESREPRTAGGRAGLAVLLFASVGMLGSVAGKFASVFINKKNMNIPTDLKDHILICHWNNRADQIIREIHDKEAEPDTEIVIASLGEIKSELLSDTKISKLHHKVCQLETVEEFESVKAMSAKSIIVLADEGASDPDSRTILTLLGLQQLLKDTPPASKPHLVAECISQQRLSYLKSAGADEVVCSERYGLGILAQSAMQKRLSDVYERLLHYTEDSNEIYIVPASELPEYCRKMNFGELSREFTMNRCKKNPAILLGIRKDGARVGKDESAVPKDESRIVLNPREADASIPIGAGDALVIVAFYRPNLKALLGSGQAVAPQAG